METIIKCAIEGGYKRYEEHLANSWGTDTYFPMVLLDPLFWQALGKSCGWNESDCVFVDWIKDGVGYVMLDGGEEIPVWHSKALRFHELNLTSGWDSAIAYLTNLIKS